MKKKGDKMRRKQRPNKRRATISMDMGTKAHKTKGGYSRPKNRSIERHWEDFED